MTAIRYGFGHHFSVINEVGGDRQKALLVRLTTHFTHFLSISNSEKQYFWACQLIYKCSICLAKLSILALYIRIFTTSSRIRTVIKTSFFFIITGGLSFVIATTFQCTPIRKAWDHRLPGHCINPKAFRWSWAAFDIITDLWIWLLPVKSFFSLNRNLPQRMGLVGVFLLGLFTCLAGILRMTGIEKSTTTHDTTWGSIAAFIWSDVEAKTALICPCLPAFKSLLCGWLERKGSQAQSQMYGHAVDTYQLSSKQRSGVGQHVAVTGRAVSSDGSSEIGILAEEQRGIHVKQEWMVNSGSRTPTSLGIPKAYD